MKQYNSAITPQEAARKCLEYADWKRQALAALAPDQRQDYRFEKPFRLTDNDIREARECRQQLLDVVVSEAYQGQWFSDQQYVWLRDNVLDYIRKKHTQEKLPTTTFELIKNLSSTRRRINTVLADLLSDGLLETQRVCGEGSGSVHYIWWLV